MMRVYVPRRFRARSARINSSPTPSTRMAGFLDLPIELFQPIIEDVILRCNKCGLEKHRGVWDNPDIISLARVNTIFEWEVFAILEKRRFLTARESFPSPELLLHPDAADFLARYILLRPYPAGSCWSANFPSLVNQVVDRVIQFENPAGNLVQVRDRYIRALCHSACFTALKEKKVGPVSNYPFRDHLLLAATHLKKTLLVNELLLLDPDLSATCSEFWRQPLNAAIRTENKFLVRRFMQLGAAWVDTPSCKGQWPCLADAVRAPSAMEMLPILLDMQGVVSFKPMHRLGGVINLAIELGKEDVADMLLDAQSGPLGQCTFGYNVRKALIEACNRNMKGLAARLLKIGGYDNGTGWGTAHLCTLIEDMCEAGHESALQVLLASSATVRSAIPRHDFVLAAAKAGHVGTIRILLKAGASLNPTQAITVLEQTAGKPHSAEAVWYLLHLKTINVDELGDFEYHIGYKVARCMATAARMGNIEFLEALARYGVPLFDRELYDNAGCHLPMEAARIFRQPETVEALSNLKASLTTPNCL